VNRGERRTFDDVSRISHAETHSGFWMDDQVVIPHLAARVHVVRREVEHARRTHRATVAGRSVGKRRGGVERICQERVFPSVFVLAKKRVKLIPGIFGHSEPRHFVGVAPVPEITEVEVVEQSSMVIERIHLRGESQQARPLLQVHEGIVSLRVAGDARESPAELNRLLHVVIALLDALLFLVLLPRGPGRCAREQRADQQQANAYHPVLASDFTHWIVSSHGGSPSRGKEKLVAVRTMNGCMAHGAGLIFLRLVMKSGGSSWADTHGKSMAFQTQQVYLRTFQQARIGRPVRCVACRAPFNFDGFVFKRVRSGFVRMAREANQILRPCSAQLARLETAVLIVAVRALHQSLVHAVMEGTVELLLFVQVASVAQIRLLRFQQKLALFGMVRVVAVGAAHSILQVDGTREITMLFAILVAVQATRAYLLRRNALERENLGLVTSALDMFLPRTMARLAAVPFRPFLRIQSRHKVWRILIVLEESFDGHVFVAGFAGLGTYVEGGIRLARIVLLFLLPGWIFLRLSAKRNPCSHKKEHQTDKKNYPGSPPPHALHHPSTRHPIPKPRGLVKLKQARLHVCDTRHTTVRPQKPEKLVRQQSD